MSKLDAVKRGEEEEVARRKLFKGTRLCKFFLAGCCSRGEACNFAHSAENLRDCPDFSKTRLCEPFMKSGTCEQGSNCKFAHSRDELRPSYLSSAKSRRVSSGAVSVDTQAQAPSGMAQDGEQPFAQLQSLMPATKAGIIHSAAMYTLILQGLSGQSSGQARAESLQLPTGSQGSPTVLAVEGQQAACSAYPGSPTELDKGGSSWSRQSTSEVDDGRRLSRQTTDDPSGGVSRQTTFSRQTTEDPSYTHSFSRQTTEEPRRQLPLSQLLSLPEPGEHTEPSSPQASRGVSAEVSAVVSEVMSRAASSESESQEPEELRVRLKNTFLHFEPDTGRKGNSRPSSLPPRFPRKHQ
mmetsp:Transcript_41433/g.92676  ORF Transcript_41433/g.92676 Transcript_41433/m.92676 type:complete len:352 (-) Transcript_41433:280-1335(-)